MYAFLYTKPFKIVALVIVGFILIQSCTIQKRNFNRGYHIEWKSKFTKEHKESVESKTSNFALNEIVDQGNNVTIKPSETDSTTNKIATNAQVKFDETVKKPIQLRYNQHPPDSIVKKESRIRYKKKVYYFDSKKVSRLKDKILLFRLLEVFTLFLLFYIGTFLLFLLLEINIPFIIFIVPAFLLILIGFFVFYFIETEINKRKLIFIANQRNGINQEKSETKVEKKRTISKRFFIFLMSVVALLALTIILFN